MNWSKVSRVFLLFSTTILLPHFALGADKPAHSSPINVSNNPAEDFSFSWSPDGKKLVFLSNRGGKTDLYSVENDGTGEMRLSEDGEWKAAPAWSTDGKRIAFMAYRDKSYYICDVDSNGTDRRELSPKGVRSFLRQFYTNQSKHPLTPGYWLPAKATYHRSADVIAFITGGSGGGNLSVRHVSNGKSITSTKGLRVQEFAWSPNGKTIATVSRQGDTTYFDVHVTDLRGHSKHLKTFEPFCGDLSWSPDGSKIALGAKQDGNWDIYLLKSDGTTSKRLTDKPGLDIWPSWSPDGKQIAYCSERGGRRDIFVFEFKTNIEVMISKENGNAICPAWSPDGSRIAFQSELKGQRDIFVASAPGPLKATTSTPSAKDLAIRKKALLRSFSKHVSKGNKRDVFFSARPFSKVVGGTEGTMSNNESYPGVRMTIRCKSEDVIFWSATYKGGYSYVYQANFLSNGQLQSGGMSKRKGVARIQGKIEQIVLPNSAAGFEGGDKKSKVQYWSRSIFSHSGSRFGLSKIKVLKIKPESVPFLCECIYLDHDKSKALKCLGHVIRSDACKVAFNELIRNKPELRQSEAIATMADSLKSR
jgi:TolB protein